MTAWEIALEADAAAWDNTLLGSTDYNVFQSFQWGEYKRAFGWTPLRCIARDERGMPKAMVQILTKKLPFGTVMGWAPGGPLYSFPSSRTEELPGVMNQLLEHIKQRSSRFIVRFNSMRPSDAGLASAFSSLLHKPLSPINSGHSIQLDLSQSIDELNRQMTSKHRYYVKKAMREKIEWKVGNEADLVRDLVSLHQEMASAKKRQVTAASIGEVSALCSSLVGHVMILAGYLGNTPVCSCLVLLIGEKAFYAIAASGESGRRIGAAYAMVPQLVSHLKEKGLKQMDFGGINPGALSARGVDHYKKGFGGKPVQYLGEWEFSSARWLKWGANFAIRYKLGLR